MSPACSENAKLVPAYLDDELAESDLREFEGHLTDCQPCKDGLACAQREHRAMRAHLKPPAAPDLLRAKLCRSLDEADEQERHERLARLRAWSLPAVACVVAACALALFSYRELKGPATIAGESAITRDAARKHFIESPMVVSDDRGMVARSAGNFLSTPVRPPRFSHQGVSLLGWEPGHLDGRQAATFVYELARHRTGRHRVNVHVLGAHDLDLSAQTKRVIEGRELWIDEALGMNTVTYRSDGTIAYVFTSDMALDELLQLVTQTDILMVLDDQRAR